MARNGYRIFDADTHVLEIADLIEPHLAAADRAKLTGPGSAISRLPAGGGMFRYRVGRSPDLDRRLGSRDRAAPSTAEKRGLKNRSATPWDVRWKGPPFPSNLVNANPGARVKDMDIEGVDVNVILPSGGVPSFCSQPDVALEQAMHQAYHRYLRDYCGRHPDRLFGVMLVSARDPDAAVAEIARCSREDWPVGILPVCPPELTLDDPAWEPIWAAAQEHDLTVVIHTFTRVEPLPPGTWDNWGNLFLHRAASHVWNAQRNMAALIGCGMMDRHPEVRLTSLESGHGWLPFWASRLDEIAQMAQHALPPLQHKPSDYIKGPRYFQSIQLHEGELSVRHVMEVVGEDTLMFATDYPHSESWFPKSVDAAMEWTTLGEETRRKLLWDNALRCFRRCASRCA